MKGIYWEQLVKLNTELWKSWMNEIFFFYERKFNKLAHIYMFSYR